MSDRPKAQHYMVRFKHRISGKVIENVTCHCESREEAIEAATVELEDDEGVDMSHYELVSAEAMIPELVSKIEKARVLKAELEAKGMAVDLNEESGELTIKMGKTKE